VAGRDLVLYDGVCGLCNALVQFVLPRDEAGSLDFASLQSATGQTWLRRFDQSTDELDTMIVISDYRGAAPRILSKAGAALMIAKRLGYPWRLAALARIFPDALLNPAYDIVARNRYRWFGRSDTCMLPRPEHRARVIDL
jgi:predicted DCC family thiol-disulfide oxidoreductase YuxK